MQPGYGETPVSPDDLAALTPLAIELLGHSPTQAAIFDLEQGIQDAVAERLLAAVLAGELTLPSILTDQFVRELHAQLYADVWHWGGKYRLREVNIGVPPELIAVETRTALENIQFRWNETDALNSRQLGIEVHAALVRIHPFVDGNGRTTRLLADLTYAAAQDSESDVFFYDWNLDKAEYIRHLREFDLHRDSTDLTAFVSVRKLR